MISRRGFLAATLGLAVPGSVRSVRPLPGRIVAGYWPSWYPDAIRLRDLPSHYNLVYLFACVPSGAAGTVVWQPPGDRRGARTHLVEDINHLRMVQGRSVILSVGGAGAGLDFDSRAKSQAFLISIHDIIAGLGGVDGLDFNTFEAGLLPAFDEYAWLSLQLKAAYGVDFMITSPPAPWSGSDKVFCQRMVQSGLMDFCAPQYYDGPGLTTQEFVIDSIGEWVGLVGADRLGVGFGINADAPDFMTTAECVNTWQAVQAAYPDIRGAYVWSLATDETNGWGFARQVGPLI